MLDTGFLFLSDKLRNDVGSDLLIQQKLLIDDLFNILVDPVAFCLELR